VRSAFELLHRGHPGMAAHGRERLRPVAAVAIPNLDEAG
jgi:hypothetical protein